MGFSFPGIKSNIVSNRRYNLFPESYAHLLISTEISDSKTTVAARSQSIRRSDRALFFACLISASIYLYGMTIGQPLAESTLALVLMFSQVFLHRPGATGDGMKVILCVLGGISLLPTLTAHSQFQTTMAPT